MKPLMRLMTLAVAMFAAVLATASPAMAGPPVPLKVETMDAGSAYNCAVEFQSKKFKCWGENPYSNFSAATPTVSNLAIEPMPGQAVVDVWAGYWHTCARKLNNNVFCFGRQLCFPKAWRNRLY